MVELQVVGEGERQEVGVEGLVVDSRLAVLLAVLEAMKSEVSKRTE
jgi:RNase P/RNase MRP subunit p29